MIEKSIKVTNEVGLHARPAAMLVKAAAKYSSNIDIRYKDKTANCKSILSLMSLRAKQGEIVSLTISGEDEEIALKEIVSLFENNFE